MITHRTDERSPCKHGHISYICPKCHPAVEPQPPHTPSLEIGEQTDFSETNTTAIAFLQKCLENGHRLRIDDIEITEYKQERVVSLKPSPAFIHTHIEKAVREENERIKDWVTTILFAHPELKDEIISFLDNKES